VGEGLNPLDVVKYTAAYAQWVKDHNPGQRMTFVAERDAPLPDSGLQKV
jgi:hypothetical protein